VRSVGDRGKEVVVSTMRTRVAVLLMMVVMVLVMPAAPALADKPAGNHGTKSFDGTDKNLGGGQERTPNAHPPRAGGDKHGGGIV
jgi:hypothetical protein